VPRPRTSSAPNRPHRVSRGTSAASIFFVTICIANRYWVIFRSDALRHSHSKAIATASGIPFASRFFIRVQAVAARNV